MSRRRSGRLLVATALVAATLGALAPAGAASTGGLLEPSGCRRDRVLVLAAMPLELYPFLEEARVSRTVAVGHRTFYVGKLAGNDVVMAMTGIGLVNARQTTVAAYERFGCFTATVFSGVAGSKRKIADVAIPARWTMDNGATWLQSDPAMLKVARTLRGTKVPLAKAVPTGDAACLCPGVESIDTPVEVEHQPQVYVGGTGTSADDFGGRALPCVPGGGDVFGCTPCLPGSTPSDMAHFAESAPSFADPSFFTDFFQPPGETTDAHEAQDMETAAAAKVARRYGVPFLGIRSASDGQGDPLHLPGFPAQFFVYRQLAGDNAATVTIAFLEKWAGR